MIKAGFHVSKSEGLVQNLEHVLSQGGLAAQFYISPKQSSHPGISISEPNVQKILKMRKEKGLYIVIHGKLILNFARPYTQKTDWQQTAMIKDMTQASRLGANVILHQGKNVKDLNFSRSEAINAFVQNLREILDKTAELGLTNKIVLENSCQQGTELGYTLNELAEIYGKLQAKYQSRVSFCIDLCHIHVAGELNMTDPVAVEKFFQDFDSKIGLSKLEVIHFNDSQVVFDGHNDSHADILVGYSGNSQLGGNPTGLKKVVELAGVHGIPLILETPGKIPYENQLRLILNWSEQIEKEYLLAHSDIIMDFTLNPYSSKGRKKKNTSKDKSKPTTAIAKKTPAVKKIQPPLVQSKIVIKPIKKITPSIKKEATTKKKVIIRKLDT